MLYVVHYDFGPYSGMKSVNASSDEEALAKVKAWAHRSSLITVASEHYKILERREA